MAWLAANWFWVVIGVAFVAMHLFGHGGHGGHSAHGRQGEGDRPRGSGERERDPGEPPAVTASSSGHQHGGGRPQ